ncbi:MAG: glycine--tRNA ligase subunit beta [Thermobacillus sp. ZCTH02-B1]|uniref:glycine--tRNA ligase subunit beta n=1 Tax=Thermobacillus sp. ZCTH02-B1 TaxID=1858795 RepID=UPI000B5634B1|nr:glycine--tRNA ligase subunit beta [Thermobacillus sp. ZCTH02-B1]OUM95965.1 MAG: glycine--tRNA ligase subunit beta [Thermobacillus sp. ZCTH02-B1]
MAEDLLLEIGMEEVPARFVRGAMDQLEAKTAEWLEASRIAFESIEAYATPRRIAVLARGVAERQADVREEVRGPARKIAVDESGNWTKAALGFARSQGVQPDELYFKETGGVEYVYAMKSGEGKPTAELLPEGLKGIIASMTFPKSMRWGSHDLRFVRPIRWIVAMYGERVVPFEIAGVTSGNVTRGHRFLGADAVLAKPAEYAEKLREQYVLADVDGRKAEILKQIGALERERGWNIAVPDDLLEEVLFLVEYPTVLYGSFDPAFLDIPQEVLITSMREHQRYFPVFDGEGRLLPHFVTVRNGDATSIDVVRRGNEKVLRARLSDAKFFYEEDRKLTIGEALGKLETIVWHEELGTMGDKARRIRRMADAVASRVTDDAAVRADISRAADICKFDLVTSMVYEFPELQGIMGEDYARKRGEREAVCRAVNEHYRPRHAGDGPPEGLVGAVVGIADKVDTIVGCFSIGIVPTGSQDPYALRRQAAGVVQTLLAHKLPVTLGELFGIALDLYKERGLKRGRDEILRDLYEFFGLRVRNVLSEAGIRYDVADAVMASGFDDPLLAVKRAEAVAEAVARGDAFKAVNDAFNRVCNLAAKAGHANVDPSLFEDEAERRLHEAHASARVRAGEALEAGDPARALEALAEMKDPINAYFDRVMVMTDNPAVRDNRLAQLAAVAADIRRIADFTKIVWP